jgi:hypothetical protein
MKRAIFALALAIILLLTIGTAALAAEPNYNTAAANAPAKGHYGVPGNGNGYGLLKGVGEGSVIHAPSDTGGGPGGAY